MAEEGAKQAIAEMTAYMQNANLYPRHATFSETLQRRIEADLKGRTPAFLFCLTLQFYEAKVLSHVPIQRTDDGITFLVVFEGIGVYRVQRTPMTVQEMVLYTKEEVEEHWMRIFNVRNLVAYRKIFPSEE